MNTQLNDALNEMVDEMQDLYSEDVIIGTENFKAILSGESLEQEIGVGGFREVIRMNISIKKADMVSVPSTGTLVTAREKSWRIFTTNPTLITYDIVVETPKK